MRFAFFICGALLALTVYALVSESSRAAITFSAPTAQAPITGCRAVRVCMDVENGQIEIYTNVPASDGQKLHAFPIPTAAPVQTFIAGMMSRAEGTLAGASSGTLGTLANPPFPGATVGP